MGKPNNLYFISNYRQKKKGTGIIQDAVYGLYMNEIVESLCAVQETEALLWEIEKEHGPEILEDVWNSLPEKEQKELLYMLNALRRKVSSIKKKTTSFGENDRSS